MGYVAQMKCHHQGVACGAAMVVKDSSKQHPAPSAALKHLTEFKDVDLKLTRNLVSIVSGIWVTVT